jgi:hypothetical protein
LKPFYGQVASFPFPKKVLICGELDRQQRMEGFNAFAKVVLNIHPQPKEVRMFFTPGDSASSSAQVNPEHIFR